MKAEEGVVLVRNLTRVHGTGPSRVEALRGLELTVARGQFVAIMGTSGSGKSTLLHLLAGLDRPNGGSIVLGGIDLVSLSEDERARVRQRQLGLVFQSFQLLDTLSAEENVALPLAIAGRSPRESRSRAAELLARVGLGQRRQHRPDQLSGGEQQRVAIARALVIEPLVLLADEPTGNLDSEQGQRIMDLLRRLVDEHGQTLLMVTHDSAHAARADRILHLRDGRLLDAPRRPPPQPDAVTWATSSLGPFGEQSVLLLPAFPEAPAGVVFARPEGGE